MPRFRVTASDVTFYRGVIEAESEEAVRILFDDDPDDVLEDMTEYDGEAMQPILIEEIKDS